MFCVNQNREDLRDVLRDGGARPIHRADQVCRNSDKCCELGVNESPNNRRAGLCDSQTKARNIPCKGQGQSRDMAESRSPSIPTHCQSSAYTRTHYHLRATRQRGCIPTHANQDLHVLASAKCCPTETRACAPLARHLLPLPTPLR